MPRDDRELMPLATPLILGGYQTDFARNLAREGTSFQSLLEEAVLGALEATKVSTADVARLRDEGRVAAFVGNFQADHYLRQAHLGAFLTPIDPAFVGVPSGRYEAACASGSIAARAAIDGIRTGDLDLAVLVGIEVMKTMDPTTGNDVLGLAAVQAEEAEGRSFPFPWLFGRFKEAVLARADAALAGGAERVTAALRQIALANYGNARANPLAQTREKNVDGASLDRLDERFADLYGGTTIYSDCCQITDGAAVVVLASDRWAAENAQAPVSEIAGWGHRVAQVRIDDKLAAAERSDWLLPWTRRAVDDAVSRGGISHADIDVIETHDCFTVSEYLALSAFRLAPPGREFEAVESGAMARDGTTPVNPSGGLIGAGHPVGATGIRMLLDAHRQVTDQAGAYQVPGARTAATLNIGGTATTNVSFVVRALSGA